MNGEKNLYKLPSGIAPTSSRETFSITSVSQEHQTFKCLKQEPRIRVSQRSQWGVSE